MEGITLYAQMINHGQSEIWLGADGKELTQRRTLATNEMVNITRRLCPPEAFQAFSKDYHAGIGHVAALLVPDLNEIATELRLKL